jgi:hypothetical protein
LLKRILASFVASLSLVVKEMIGVAQVHKPGGGALGGCATENGGLKRGGITALHRRAARVCVTNLLRPLSHLLTLTTLDRLLSISNMQSRMHGHSFVIFIRGTSSEAIAAAERGDALFTKEK